MIENPAQAAGSGHSITNVEQTAPRSNTRNAPKAAIHQTLIFHRQLCPT
ncbi:hypothetical protein [Neisseria iguanae]|nr:hypothetical protein [Neisseria iguanae]